MTYKFRGISVYDNQFVYGSLIKKRNGEYYIQDDNGLGSDVITETIGEYILTIRGVDFYEGDFVKKWGQESPTILLEKKEHSDEYDSYFGYNIDSSCRNAILIGNVHENPSIDYIVY